ncbi:cytoskeletal protein CcmA (bactofilin family) [Alkalibacillus flavidus]|uniref:Cytoskeletal protein CcmA (Bactofilin family) n=1 Tax=Alkalibacillus flavidus TaxID=546021 RepID=A0ABV2KW48_9BACI
MFSKQDKQVSQVDTVIGAGTSVEGQIKSQASVRIDGSLKGDIYCEGDLEVGASGHLEADVHGRDVTVSGHIHGNVHASGTLTIQSTGVVDGDITMGVFVIEEGGRFTGHSHMRDHQSSNQSQNQDETEHAS